MPDESDPPRKFYEFKPREFENVNRPKGESLAGTPVSVQDHLRQAAASKAVPTPVKPAPPAQPGPIGTDVHGILRVNLERANEAGLNELAAKPERRSRRKRDYWILMVVGNGILVPLAISGMVTHNAILFVYCVAAITLFTCGVSWIMWQVMDDY